MKIEKQTNNMLVMSEEDKIFYLYSYKTLIAKVNNVYAIGDKINNDYGLYLSAYWDYSQTTLKQLYEFIGDYTTQRDDTNNTVAYMLMNSKNKKAYLQKLIEKNIIKHLSI